LRQLITILTFLISANTFGQYNPEYIFKKYYDGLKYFYPDSMLWSNYSRPQKDSINGSLNYKPGQLQVLTKLDNTTVKIYFVNATDTTVIFQVQDGWIPMIREALDENGEWRPIEYWYWSDCGNSFYDNNLQPMTQYSMTTFLYGGAFKTKIRFKLLLKNYILYSDTYEGRINKKQFVKLTYKFNSSFLDLKR
jgi:hypothetical protein